jgi:hypothetical protein
MSIVAERISANKRDVFQAAAYRMRLGSNIGLQLEMAALEQDDAEALAMADMIKESARPENIYHAIDLQNADGECFDGYGSLNYASSRLDPAYMAISSRRAHKRADSYMARVRPQSGDYEMLVTCTMPTLIGFGYERTVALFDDASRRLRQSKYFKDHVRGGIRGEEFTLGDQRCERHRKSKTPGKSRECQECSSCKSFRWSFDKNGYHFHAHYVLWSKWLDWKELGEVWTRCLGASAKKFGINLNFDTEHGRAVVDIRHVTANGKGKKTVTESDAMLEACKYIVKGSDFEKLPASELVEVERVLRGRRMIEPLGEANTRKGSTENRTRQPEQTHNLDTQGTIESLKTKKKRRRESLREKGVRWIRSGRRDKWLKLLKRRYRERRAWRIAQLSEKFPYARFQTLDGYRWSGLALSVAPSTSHRSIQDAEPFKRRDSVYPVLVASQACLW